MVSYKILILLSLIVICLFIQFIYFPKINNKIYLEGKKIISKLRKVKKKDQSFNSIKKYYINLDRSIERKESIEKEFRLYGIVNYERVSACDGKNMEKKKEGKFGDIKFKAPNDRNTSMRELATTCSHIKAIKRAYDNGDELAIIMEDDNKFTLMPYWDKGLKELINELPNDWEIFKLISCFEENFIYLKKFFDIDISDKFKNQKIVKRNKNNSSAVCYVINKKGMRKMLNLFYQKDYINLIYRTNMIDREIFNNFIVYETKKNLFLLDSFDLESTIYDRNLYWDSLQILKSYDI